MGKVALLVIAIDIEIPEEKNDGVATAGHNVVMAFNVGGIARHGVRG